VTSVAEWESEVISHAAPTFCIQMPKFDTRAASQRARKRDELKGAQVVDKVSLDTVASMAAYVPSGMVPVAGPAPRIMFSMRGANFPSVGSRVRSLRGFLGGSESILLSLAPGGVISFYPWPSV
jgi:hypothetical protein